MNEGFFEAHSQIYGWPDNKNIVLMTRTSRISGCPILISLMPIAESEPINDIVTLAH